MPADVHRATDGSFPYALDLSHTAAELALPSALSTMQAFGAGFCMLSLAGLTAGEEEAEGQEGKPEPRPPTAFASEYFTAEDLHRLDQLVPPQTAASIVDSSPFHMAFPMATSHRWGSLVLGASVAHMAVAVTPPSATTTQRRVHRLLHELAWAAFVGIAGVVTPMDAWTPSCDDVDTPTATQRAAMTSSAAFHVDLLRGITDHFIQHGPHGPSLWFICRTSHDWETYQHLLQALGVRQLRRTEAGQEQEQPRRSAEWWANILASGKLAPMIDPTTSEEEGEGEGEGETAVWFGSEPCPAFLLPGSALCLTALTGATPWEHFSRCFVGGDRVAVAVRTLLQQGGTAVLSLTRAELVSPQVDVLRQLLMAFAALPVTTETPAAAGNTSRRVELEGDRAFASMDDVPALPIQPLGQHLSNRVYSTFEADAVKYEQYRDAVERLIRATTPGDGSEGEVPSYSVDVLVVGAGRGPLLLSAAEGARRAGTPMDAITFAAVEKNPFTIPHLRHRIQEMASWGVVPTPALIVGDMREAQTIDAAIQWFDKMHHEHHHHQQQQQEKEQQHNHHRRRILIVLSELLGSWGDNEWCPECLGPALARCRLYEKRRAPHRPSMEEQEGVPRLPQRLPPHAGTMYDAVWSVPSSYRSVVCPTESHMMTYQVLHAVGVPWVGKRLPLWGMGSALEQWTPPTSGKGASTSAALTHPPTPPEDFLSSVPASAAFHRMYVTKPSCHRRGGFTSAQKVFEFFHNPRNPRSSSNNNDDDSSSSSAAATSMRSREVKEVAFQATSQGRITGLLGGFHATLFDASEHQGGEGDDPRNATLRDVSLSNVPRWLLRPSDSTSSFPPNDGAEGGDDTETPGGSWGTTPGMYSWFPVYMPLLFGAHGTRTYAEVAPGDTVSLHFTRAVGGSLLSADAPTAGISSKAALSHLQEDLPSAPPTCSAPLLGLWYEWGATVKGSRGAAADGSAAVGDALANASLRHNPMGAVEQLLTAPAAPPNDPAVL